MGQRQRRHGQLLSIQARALLCFKNGGASHTNTFELGQHGRYRTNVWEYAGVNTFRNGRLDELAMHPTSSRFDDCRCHTRRDTARGIVLDPFAGSGTTVIAAEKTGRHARVIEYDPGYCDVIVCRWQKYTGKTATLDGSNRTFEDIEMNALPSPKENSILAERPRRPARCCHER